MLMSNTTKILRFPSDGVY